MGNAVLATVNPVFGLYTLMVATPVGALFTSSVFMNVSTTGALSVAAGDALVYFPGEQKIAAMITLVLLVGLFQLTLGLLRLGSLIRFVSQSVMTGFITGIAILIVLGAIPDLTGYTSQHSSEILRLADTLLNLLFGWEDIVLDAKENEDRHIADRIESIKNFTPYIRTADYFQSIAPSITGSKYPSDYSALLNFPVFEDYLARRIVQVGDAISELKLVRNHNQRIVMLIDKELGR